ncbi:hypothetical protein BJ165DRAFT_1593005 [Panaeolus papilionaceus]|nr:hypothetical protein BJ165DRAFT_1593005 [Panaeolus papilionaceus]
MLAWIKQMLQNETAASQSPSKPATAHCNVDDGDVIVDVINRNALLQPIIPSSELVQPVTAAWTGIIPPEVVLFHIINTELSDHVPTLKSLSLTCRFLHSHVQQYIFRTVHIRRTHQNTSSSMAAPNVASRFLITIHRHPDILQHTRSLKITIMTAVKANDPDEHARFETNCLFFIMRQSYPNLEELQLAFDESWHGDLQLFPWIEFQENLAHLLQNSKVARVMFSPPGLVGSALLRGAIEYVNHSGGLAPVYSDVERDSERVMVRRVGRWD